MGKLYAWYMNYMLTKLLPEKKITAIQKVKYLSIKWSRSVVSDSLRPHGLQPTRLLCPWDFPGNSTGVDCHFLLQGIFPTQGLNPGLPHCRQTLYHLSHQGSPKYKLQSKKSPIHFKFLLLFSHWIMSDSLQPHGLQHARLPCPSLISWSLPKLMSNDSMMPFNHLLLCSPLLLPSIFPSIRVFSNELALIL